MAQGPTRILLVEDDPGDVLLLCELLKDAEPANFSVERTERLEEAAQRAAAGGFDIVLLDVSLPDAQGLDGVSRLRQKSPDVPILVLTGLNDPSFAAAAGRAGAQDYLVKGQLSAAGLARSIRHCVERHRLELSVRRQNEEMERMHRQEGIRREFIANVSHELRTPIAAIKGAAETLRLGAVADEKNRMRFIQIIERHSARLNELVEDILLISSLESEKIHETASVELAPLVERLVKKLAAQLRRRRVSVGVAVPPGLCVRAGERHLTDAVRHLLSNAVEYNREGGRVEVVAEPRQGEAVLRVQDSGIGISAADLSQIFERFHRSPISRVMKPDSTGLGLFIVKRVAEAYGGRAWAESEEGRGSTFSLALPLADASKII